LQLDSGSHISGAISGFHSGGAIDMRDLCRHQHRVVDATDLRVERQRHADRQGGVP
jgi:hypothetical protein